MSGFLETSEGWVNVDHIMRLWHAAGREAGAPSLIELTDGRKLHAQILGYVASPPVPARLHLETDVGSTPEGAAPAFEGDVGFER